MPETPATDQFHRTLPLFDSEDRDTVQRLLHHAVEDLRYDHPDRKLARDLYHEVQEGDAIRLLVGSGFDQKTFVLTPGELDTDIGRILDRFVEEMSSKPGEWRQISADLREWRRRGTSGTQLAFEYLY